MAKTKGTKSHTMIAKTPHRKPHDCATSMNTLNLPRFLVLCVLFVDRCLSFCLFSFLVIVLPVLLRFTDSNYLPLVSSNSC